MKNNFFLSIFVTCCLLFAVNGYAAGSADAVVNKDLSKAKQYNIALQASGDDFYTCMNASPAPWFNRLIFCITGIKIK